MTVTAAQLLQDRPRISVGIVTADLLSLGTELNALESVGVELVHLDVMDGVYSPMATFGPPIVRAIPGTFVKDVHLMVEEPLEKVHQYVEAGAGIVTFQVESSRHPHRVLQSLASTGVVRGVALNPGTPLAVVEPLIDEMELLLILAINPGWSGQRFVPSTERRITEAKRMLLGHEVVLGVDGGITRSNVGRMVLLGADLIVTGSAVFDGGNASENARDMLEAMRGHDLGAIRAGTLG